MADVGALNFDPKKAALMQALKRVTGDQPGADPQAVAPQIEQMPVPVGPTRSADLSSMPFDQRIKLAQALQDNGQQVPEALWQGGPSLPQEVLDMSPRDIPAPATPDGYSMLPPSPGPSKIRQRPRPGSNPALERALKRVQRP